MSSPTPAPDPLGDSAAAANHAKRSRYRPTREHVGTVLRELTRGISALLQIATVSGSVMLLGTILVVCAGPIMAANESTAMTTGELSRGLLPLGIAGVAIAVIAQTLGGILRRPGLVRVFLLVALVAETMFLVPVASAFAVWLTGIRLPAGAEISFGGVLVLVATGFVLAFLGMATSQFPALATNSGWIGSARAGTSAAASPAGDVLHKYVRAAEQLVGPDDGIEDTARTLAHLDREPTLYERARHEAAHAVVAAVQGFAVTDCHIYSIGNSRGATHILDAAEDLQEDLWGRLVVHIAGSITDSETGLRFGAGHDFQQSAGLAMHLVAIGTPSDAYPDSIGELVRTVRATAQAILTEHAAAVRVITTHLLEHRSISGTDVRAAIATAGTPA